MQTDRLEPIALAELVERAALMTRVDRKYVIPASLLPTLTDELPTSTRILEIAKQREFKYHSTYFDTRRYSSYLEAGIQAQRRFKVRTRSYIDTDDHFLEVKVRSHDGQTRKLRRPTPRSNLQTLSPDDQSYIQTVLSDSEIKRPRARLNPVLETSFERTTLFLPRSTSRVTIDVSLGFASPLTPEAAYINSELAVIETKASPEGGPGEVDLLLEEMGYAPARMSKYGVGLAVMNPRLPWLKWHEVMVSNFIDTSSSLLAG